MTEAAGWPTKRPFYHEFAWAYDHLITEPLEPQVEAFTEGSSGRWLSRTGRSDG